jgi:hypothetical protein
MISGAGIARGGISAAELGPSGGAGNAAGIATAMGVGASLVDSVGSVAGIASVSGVGASVASSVGSVTAIADVSGVGAALVSATGSVTASCAVSGIGAARVSTVGAVDGVCTVNGAGAAILNRASTVWRRYVVNSFRQELSPPILSAEQAVVDFDFGPEMIAGEAVLLPPVLTCSATWGVDDAASARIIGDATVNPSPSTALADGAVAQLVGGMHGGARYKLQCSVVTTRGQTLSRSAYLNCNS